MDPPTLGGESSSRTKRASDAVQTGSTKRPRLELSEGSSIIITSEPGEVTGEPTNTSSRDAAGYAKSRKGKEKDWKNVGRRRSSRNDEAPSARAQMNDSVSKPPRLPKRQCALLIGFCGTGCNGMQIQPHVRTIEGLLFDAMVKAGAVSQDNADDPVKVNLGRAARTDAGVHAAGNVVSIKMITAVPGVPDIVSRINSELPPEIRMWGFVRVQNSFNARLSCDSRKYTYFFPSYLLIPPKPGSGLHRALESPPEVSGSFWCQNESDPSDHWSDMHRKREWRISHEQVELLRETAQKFEGTHNFHNFTVGRDISDRSVQRHMKKIEVSDPGVYGDTEWISVLFHGQSFMLHQRKMMSALVLICRTVTPAKVIDELYGPQVVFLPKMPSLGLLLEQPIFDSYNRKVAALNAKLQSDHPDYRPPIDFSIYTEAIDGFKQKYIYDNMRAIEDRDGIFDSWIRSIDSYSGNDLRYLNAQGIIPPTAVIQRGVGRENPLREKKRFDATGFTARNRKAQADEEEDDEEEDEQPIENKYLAEMEG